MSLGRAEANGGLLRGALRAMIILAAIALVILVLAPTARAAGPQHESDPPTVEPASGATYRSASVLPAYESVRPGQECATGYRTEAQTSTARSVAAWSDQSDRSVPADHSDAVTLARGPCGQPPPFDSYGLGSLLWHGPEWGVPALGHRT